MATGGREDSDIFECAVCLNNMLGRTPRGLPCLHTFCDTCLTKLIQNNRIICPTCRSPTQLKGNTVRELPINFMLNKIKDLGSTQGSTDQPPSVCQICKRESPGFKCEDCPRLMCSSCKNEHNDIKKYKDHSVFDLCMKHEDSITDICTKCMLPLCMTCMVVDHKHHKEYFEDLEAGLSKMNLKENVNRLQDDIKDGISKMDAQIQMIQENSKKNADTELQLLERDKYFKDKIEEICELLKTTDKNKKTFDKMNESYNYIRNECNVVMASLEGLIQDESGSSMTYAELRDKAEEATKAVKKWMSTKCDTTLIELNEHVTAELVKSRDAAEETVEVCDIKMSKIIVDIPMSKRVNCREEVDFIASDVVLVTFKPPRPVVRLDPQGQVIRRYYPAMKNEWVSGVKVHGDYIYIVQSTAITRISGTNPSNTVTYKPNIGQNMGKIFVKDKSTIYITPYNSPYSQIPGSIYAYNTERDKTELVLEGLNWPTYINMVQTKTGPKFIVTESGSHCLSVYDAKWKFLNTVGGGQLNRPSATAITPMGSILIADRGNHRICHFTLDGEFINDVITKRDGIKEPIGVAYRPPNLWVCTWQGHVKCFLTQNS